MTKEFNITCERSHFIKEMDKAVNVDTKWEDAKAAGVGFTYWKIQMNKLSASAVQYKVIEVTDNGMTQEVLTKIYASFI